MINDFPLFFGALSGIKQCEMESHLAVQHNLGSNNEKRCLDTARCDASVPCIELYVARSSVVMVDAAVEAAAVATAWVTQPSTRLSVIFASHADIAHPLLCPSFKDWGAMPNRGSIPVRSASSNSLPPLSLYSLTFFNNQLLIAPAISTENIMLSNSNNSKLVNNENNMQSVNFSLRLEHLYANKCTVKDSCLSNVSVIICVPQSFKNNYYYKYSNITTVTEPMIQRNNTAATVGKITFGAFKRVHENIQSQQVNEILDNNFYYNLIVKFILINQIDGDEPDDCIPVMINAITVQGISYRGGPHSRSFNLINSRMMNEGLHHRNKSDYASKISNSIIIKKSKSMLISRESRSHDQDYGEIYAKRLPENDKLSINEYGSNIVVNMDDTYYVHLDNNDFNDTLDENDISERQDEKSTECVPVDRFKDGQPTFASLLRGDYKTQIIGKSSNSSTLLRRCLRLCGGGESSLNNATGWGSPPSNNGNAGNWGSIGQGGGGSGASNPTQQWGSNTQRPPVSQADVNSNKGSGGPNNMPVTSSASGATSGTSGVPNAGWQSQPPPQPNNPNLPMNGSSNSNQGNSGGNISPNGTNSGNGSPGGNISSNSSIANSAKNQLEQLSNMRETLFSQDGWGGQHVNQDTNWDVPGSPEPGVKVDQSATGGGPPLWKPNINNGTDLWEANLRNGGQPPPPQTPKTPWGHTPTSNIGGTWGEDDEPSDAANVWTGPPPQQQWGAAAPPQPPHWPKKDDWGAWGEPNRPPDLYRPDLHRPDLRQQDPHDLRDPRDPRYLLKDLREMRDLRGDPRGISGRLNGSLNPGEVWPMRGAPPPAKLLQTHAAKPGWEEPSPPAQRRAAPAYDDGSWQRGPQRPPTHSIPPARLPTGPVKPDTLWMQPPRNGSWDEGPTHTGGWDKDTGGAWNDGGSVNPGWGGPKQKPGPGGWDSDISDWGPKPPSAGPPAKMLPKDTVWNSKQFQLLVGMGYKKDEVEEALRSRNMNAEEAAELLSQMRGGGAMDAWRRHEEHGGPPFDHQPPYPPQQRPQHSFPPQQPPNVPYQPVNISPAIAQKILNQPTSQPPPPYNQPNSQSGVQPCANQLRQLVQQIQMAVSNGFLNHQILNQPLAPPTLVLLNQLLQQIKSLHQLVTQQNMVQNSLGSSGKANSSAVLHISVQITKTKQQIHNLQNQITAQQALYMKQQGGGGGSGGGSSDFFKPPNHDPLVQLQNNFSDMSLSKDPQTAYGGVSGVNAGGQQSRLTQWKLPSLDKDSEDFSRAPGSVAKSATSPLTGLSNSDGPWGAAGRGGDAWGGGETDLTDGKDSWPVTPQSVSAYTDLVPEFEPGKPWKMKIIEDDPAITPGSVVRSPLSLAGMKESELFATGKSSPAAPERTLSSSTWSYPASGGGVSVPFKTVPTSGKAWGDNGANEWGKRAPPPGLNKSGPAGVGGSPWGAHQPTPIRPTQHQPSWQSTWLLLKNLTAQIDGSTLKTLCVQHGPLQSFHLYLNQGIALAKYSTREEANKAQTALNNCVLGNTTIFAEAPADSDVNMILQHLGQGGSGGQWRGGGAVGAGGGAPTPSNKPDQAWSFTNSLWGAGSGPDDGQRTTPSSLNSFLPPDLLGGESV